MVRSHSHSLATILLSTAAFWGCGGDDDATTPDGGGAPPAECASTSECDDRLFCNGPEVCGEGGFCVPGTAPCEAALCDESSRSCASCATDADGDGARAIECGGDDCDDSDPARFPANTEVCDADHVDEDCDPTTYGAKDLDRDGFDDAFCCNEAGDGTRTCGEDCDDTRRGTNPIVPEVCDRRDNDCDGAVDEEVALELFRDADRDLHGDPSTPAMACAGVVGFSSLDDDCDDADRFAHGAQVEITDGVDNDCDTLVDEAAVEATWYRDADGDGFGDAAGGTLQSSTAPAGYSLLATDCDDADPERSPLATELCNAVDDDCSGDGDYVIGVNDWEDDDGDGQLDVACPGSSGGRDCNDRDPDVYSGAPERCNRIDDDCDTRIDESCSGGADAGVPMDSDAGAPSCGAVGQACCAPGALGDDPDADGCTGTAMTGNDCEAGTCRSCTNDGGLGVDCSYSGVCAGFGEVLSCTNTGGGFSAICCRPVE